MTTLLIQQEDSLTVLTGDKIFPAFGINDPGDPILKATGVVEFQDAALVSIGEDFLLYVPNQQDSWLKKVVFWLAKKVLV